MICSAALAGVFFIAPFAGAQGDVRAYWYDRIDISAEMHADTTVSITERQTFVYEGEYHKGWRSIPLEKIGRITDILVIDGETGAPLSYSSRTLEKTDPASWGKFTFHEENGAMNIEWYYDLRDTSHLWTIAYTVHGGMSFFDDHDEFYWNLFTDYEVPVNEVSAIVTLPSSVSDIATLSHSFYSSALRDRGQDLVSGVRDNQTFFFTGANIAPRQALTIAVGWPKGIVHEREYWFDALIGMWAYLLSGIIVAGTILWAAAYWYIKERMKKGRGTIIPQYEPPEHMRPAVLDMLLHERITKRAWPAIIVDLAVRGHLIIRAENPTALERVTYKFLPVIPQNFLFGKGQYRIEKNPRAEERGLAGYERELIGLLFSLPVSKGAGYFSTRESAKDRSTGLYMQKGLKNIERSLQAETDLTTKAFEIPLMQERKFDIIKTFAIGFIFLFVILMFRGVIPSFLFRGDVAILGSILLSVLVIYYFLRYEARLNEKGHVMREDILGFKWYLETAERYRMQNLTPDIFEKYLPYAMIFGVEKKWTRAFESVSIPAPSWYGGTVGGGFSNGRVFLPSAFASSFSASFASAFSNNGASGGGGGAGGGGGGGGGGAS